MKLLARDLTLEFGRTPALMGIVNLSPDSFSGDGTDDISAALALAEQQIAEGATIIDVGAESARTNREAIPEELEIERLVSFVRAWNDKKTTNASGTPIALSINTWRTNVASAVLEIGGDMLNDMSGLPDAGNAQACARTGAALLIMHSVGAPKVPHTHVAYPDVLAALHEFFTTKIALAEAAGVSRSRLILDPGLDFAKQRADNLRIMQQLDRLHAHGLPVLLPISRKTFIGETLALPSPANRDAGTIACAITAALAGIHILRVHNVRAVARALRVMEALRSI